jgi:hypothetical protein
MEGKLITYDENGIYLGRVFKSYNEYKNTFIEFKNLIRPYLSENKQFEIIIKEEKDTKLVLEFIDKQLNIEFAVIKYGDRNFLGKLAFSKVNINEERETKIDQIYFDRHGNVKKSPADSFSELNLKQSDSALYLLKHWLVMFIESDLEID